MNRSSRVVDKMSESILFHAQVRKMEIVFNVDREEKWGIQ